MIKGYAYGKWKCNVLAPISGSVVKMKYIIVKELKTETMGDMETRLKLLLNPMHSRKLWSYIQYKISFAKLHERTFVKAIRSEMIPKKVWKIDKFSLYCLHSPVATWPCLRKRTRFFRTHDVLPKWVLKMSNMKMTGTILESNISLTHCDSDSLTSYDNRELLSIASENGSMPDGSRPLPEPMAANRKWSPVVFIWGQFGRKCS